MLLRNGYNSRWCCLIAWECWESIGKRERLITKINLLYSNIKIILIVFNGRSNNILFLSHTKTFEPYLLLGVYSIILNMY